ncbi:MAG: RagB/SusD family nutrient uptake outer membrane protein [Bacteroidales bacterium]|nr:RagB/SusD family nutrient uptake outer membrane protein [Bacteroidales bacterium]
MIDKCNLVIDKAEEISISEDQLEELEQIVDQAKFLRALGYYNLVTLYGDVPLIIHWLDDTKEMDFERSPKSQIWELIEQDLKDAAKLPLRSQTEFGRATHGAVYALLGKAYMWQKKYEQAVEAYTAIIESGEYQLVEDYGLIHRNEGEDCSESIFEFQREMGVDGGHMATWEGIFRMPREDPFGWGFDIPTVDLVREFEQGDPRLLYTVNFIGDVFPAPWGQYVVENGTSATGYTTRKAWIPWGEREFDTYFQSTNWRYCRYAEVLLFYAEALNETDQRDQARIYLNMVRQRARNSPKIDPQRISSVWDSTYIGELLPDITTSNQEELRNAIWHEQRVELAQEGHRRWILLRTKRFKERMETAKGHLGCTVEDHELLLPIPDSEVETSQGRIKQNPGYQ